MDHPSPPIEAPHALQLPPEIWMAIIRNEDEDLDHTSLDYCSQKPHWPACSLVSQQWRSITLPYLFRHISIPNRRSSIPEYVKFFTDTPTIARLVRHINISHQNIDIDQLDDLLGCLPNVRFLRLIAVDLRCRRESDSQLLYRHYELDLLDCYCICNFSRWSSRLLQLLALFSKLNRFELSVDDAGSFGALQDVSRNALKAIPAQYRSRPKIRSLYLDCGANTYSFLPSFLLDVGALSSLTELSMDIGEPDKLPEYIDELLCSVGPRLRSLSIALLMENHYWDSDLGTWHTSIRQMVINKLHQGLIACSVLEEFSLTTTVFPLEETAVSVYQQEWLRIVEIVTLLPSRRIRRLRLDVAFITSALNSVHLLSWSSLQAVCHGLANISSLELLIRITNPDGAAEPENADPCVQYEMQDFKAVLVLSRGPERFLECNDHNCVNYNTSGRWDGEQRMIES